MAYKKVPKIKRDKDGNYPMSREQQINAAKEFEGKYMIATKAEHKLGDIGREFDETSSENLCCVYKEIKGYWVGSWVTGMGFFNVCFPKDTTRELNEKEVKYFSKMYVQIANQPPIKLKID